MPVIAPTSVRTVTVGIPASNEEKSIGQMLESVLHQAIPQGVLLTTVVVANACTDQTVQVALGVIEQVLGIVARPVESEEGRTWVAEARPITACVIDIATGGKANALNIAHRLQDADAVLLFDSDVVLEARAIHRMIEALETAPELVVAPSVEGHIQPYDRARGFWRELCRVMVCRAINDFDRTTPRLDGRVCGYRRCALVEHPSLVAVDMWLEGDAWLNGVGVTYLDAILVRYRLPASLPELVDQYKRYDVTVQDLDVQHAGLLAAIRSGRSRRNPSLRPALHSRVVGWMFFRYVASSRSNEVYDGGEPWQAVASTKG